MHEYLVFLQRYNLESLDDKIKHIHHNMWYILGKKDVV